MVKKSRRQREGTDRVYPYNVVDQDIPGQNTDSFQASVACDEYSTTMSQPKSRVKRRGVLRLQNKNFQYKSSELEGGSGDWVTKRSSAHLATMHAVANGERMEAFKNGERETNSGGGHPPSLGAEARVVGKRAAHDRPCPKSRKSRDDGQSSEQRPQQTETTEAVAETEENVRNEKEDADDSGVVQEEDEERYLIDERNVGDSSAEASVNGNVGSEVGIEESEVDNEGSEAGNAESEVGIAESEVGVAESEVGNAESEVGNTESGVGNAESEIGNAESDVGNAESEVGNAESDIGNAESEIGNEGSEIGNAESYVGNEESEIGNEGSEIGNAESDVGNEGSVVGNAESDVEKEGSEFGNEGIVTEPEDHAGYQESCNLSDPDVTISYLEGEEELEEEGSDTDRPEGDPPLVEFPADSPGKTPQTPMDPEDSDLDEYETEEGPNTTLGYKVLHRLLNPTIRSSTPPPQPPEERETTDFSFGRSLRSMSGRRSIRPLGRDDGVRAPTPAPAESFFSFGFGKRKSEGGGEREPDAKRLKPDAAVDSLGFFARLTSPVIDRLRAIRVGSPFRSREVTGHEEMAVSFLPVAKPLSERCVLM